MWWLLRVSAAGLYKMTEQIKSCQPEVNTKVQVLLVAMQTPTWKFFDNPEIFIAHRYHTKRTITTKILQAVLACGLSSCLWQIKRGKPPPHSHRTQTISGYIRVILLMAYMLTDISLIHIFLACLSSTIVHRYNEATWRWCEPTFQNVFTSYLQHVNSEYGLVRYINAWRSTNNTLRNMNFFLVWIFF